MPGAHRNEKPALTTGGISRFEWKAKGGGMGVSLSGPTPEYLSVKEAAAELAVSVDVVYSLIRSGRLAAERIGGRWRIPRKSLWAVSHRRQQVTIEEVYERLIRIEAGIQQLLVGGCPRCRCNGGAEVPAGGV